MEQEQFFEQMCTLVVVGLMPIYIKVESCGIRYRVNSDRTMVAPEFFIRFIDGSTVMLVWDDTRNALNVSIAFDGGCEVDGAFDMPYKNNILSGMNPAVLANTRASLRTKYPLGDETWHSELHDSILMILNHAETGKLSELFSKNGTDSDGAKYVDITPPTKEPEQVSEEDYYKKFREFKF